METQFLEQFDLPNPTFRPEPWYNVYGDCIVYLAANEASIADRVDSALTLYRSAEDRRVIGFQLKDVHALMESVGADGVVVGSESEDDEIVSVFLLLLTAAKKSETTATPDGLAAYSDVFETLAVASRREVAICQPST